MKNLLSAHLPAARSLVGIAHEMLVETRNAAQTKVCDLRSQVEELWQAADEMLPRAETANMVRHVKRTYEALRIRDMIRFPRLEN